MTDGRLPTSRCPDPETLAAFMDGRLQSHERSVVEAHLSDCDDCYETWMVARTVQVARHDSSANRPPLPITRPSRGAVAMIGLAATLVIGVLGSWWWSADERIERGLRALAGAERAVRFTQARLSIDTRWRPAPSAMRNPSEQALSRSVDRALLDLRDITETQGSPRAQHALGLTHLIAGRIDAAVESLTEATSGLEETPRRAARVDLAAALISQYEQDQDLTHVVAALEQSKLVLREVPTDLTALFGRAVAEEIIGPASLAIAAWEDYLTHDGGSAWADEARRRLEALRKELASAAAGTNELFHDVERRLLPAWSAWVMAGATGTAPDLVTALADLRQATPDLELVHLLEVAIAAEDPVRRSVAEAVEARSAWLINYENGELGTAEENAEALRRRLRAASLDETAAEARAALVAERNSVFGSMEGLAARAETAGYLRLASLLRISYGNTAQRRTQPMIGVDQFEKARTLARRAGDRELAATASAMRADAYRNLGDERSAWQALQEAMADLPSMSNRRLQYSVLRAIADAAVDGGYVAASLDYSELLVAATQDWSHPGARILSHLRRTEALLTLNDSTSATVDLAGAEALLPAVSDLPLRGEYEAEVRLLKGRVLIPTEPEEAIRLLTEALTFFESRGTTSRRAAVLLARGQAHKGRRDLVKAEQDWASAASMITDDRIEIRQEQLRISRLSALWQTFSELIAIRLDRPELALSTVESVRARELLDSLSPDQQPKTLSGSDLWTWLPEDASALVYSVLPTELAVWTVTRRGAVVRRVGIPEAELTRLVDKAAVEFVSGERRHVDTLSRYLLEGLGTPRSGGRLLVVTDGPLHRVPFSALTLPGSNQRLIEAWTPMTAPSLSVARELAGRSASPDGAVLLAGDGRPVPRDRLPGLPGIALELQALKRIYPQATWLEGAGAKPDSVAELAESSSLIHLAGHAVVNKSFPSRSRLVLAPESGTEGLYPSRIAGLHLKKKPVVVLSACDTATGRVFRSEGALSLARPFVQAGASAVVAALRPLTDGGAPAALAGIHAELAGGQPVYEALARWQRRAIANGVGTGLWSTFVVVGGPAHH